MSALNALNELVERRTQLRQQILDLKAKIAANRADFFARGINKPEGERAELHAQLTALQAEHHRLESRIRGFESIKARARATALTAILKRELLALGFKELLDRAYAEADTAANDLAHDAQALLSTT